MFRPLNIIAIAIANKVSSSFAYHTSDQRFYTVILSHQHQYATSNEFKKNDNRLLVWRSLRKKKKNKKKAKFSSGISCSMSGRTRKAPYLRLCGKQIGSSLL